jgi:uncharacterized protein
MLKIKVPNQIYAELSVHDRSLPLSPELLAASGLETQLVSGGFISYDPVEDNQLLELVLANQPEPLVQSLFLMASCACNLRCSYCLLSKPGSGTFLGSAKTMSSITARAAIDLFARTVADNPKNEGYWQAVTFYGGEPLLNEATLRDAVDYIHLLQAQGLLWPQTELVVNTNGTILNEDFANFAALHGIEVQVSLDGFREVHDANRVDLQGQGTFDQAVEAVKRLVRAGAKVTPMITVTDTNIPALADFVCWMAQELGINAYMMNLLMSETGNPSPDYPKRAARAMWQAYHRNLNLSVTDYAYAGTLGAFTSSEVAKPSCGANGRKMTVFPDGKIHTCQALERSEISSISDLTSFNTELPSWLYWKQRSRFNNPQCLRCVQLGVCGAGCAAGAYHANGDAYSCDPNHCQWLRETFSLWLDQN